MIRSMFGEPSSCLRPARSQTMHGPRIRSSSIPAQITFARSSSFDCMSPVVPCSISRLTLTTSSLEVSPPAILSMSASSSAVISGVAIRGTYFLNASYIAIPVAVGTGGLLNT